MKKKISEAMRRAAAAALCLALCLAALSGCGGDDRLSPKSPVTISVWHYYGGGMAATFDSLVDQFNETCGMDKGIIVESFAMGSIDELEKAMRASIRQEPGSREVPNIFTSYADTAYVAETAGILANLDDYFSPGEQDEYVQPFIDEGRIGLQGELRILPIAKATEVLMLNETDWAPFAEECGLSYENLATKEELVATAELYYQWTDARTPGIPNDGKAFYGRDSVANLFVIGAMEYGQELFIVDGVNAAVNADREAMKAIWDCYYVPYISGCFTSAGRYRSDDAKVGELLAYVGSTSSALYFPDEVTVDNTTYPVEASVLPVPYTEGRDRVAVQQGAGMAVVKATPKEELACAEFLKWFTEADTNAYFSVASGYMPVKKETSVHESIIATAEEQGLSVPELTSQTLHIALEQSEACRLYTGKGFAGGVEARDILENHLQDKAEEDRQAVLELIAGGLSRDEAVSQFSNDDCFSAWLEDFIRSLENAIAAANGG